TPNCHRFSFNRLAYSRKLSAIRDCLFAVTTTMYGHHGPFPHGEGPFPPLGELKAGPRARLSFAKHSRKAVEATRHPMFAMPPIATESEQRSETTRCANSGLMRCSKWTPYSITSSARTTTESGIDNPIAFAVLRLRTMSNFVACSTGRSAGFAPWKIRSTKYAARLYMAAKFSP